jgi:hypothetical protein
MYTATFHKFYLLTLRENTELKGFLLHTYLPQPDWTVCPSGWELRTNARACALADDVISSKPYSPKGSWDMASQNRSRTSGTPCTVCGRAQRDGLLKVDRDRFFAEMSVLGRDRVRDWKKSSVFKEKCFFLVHFLANLVFFELQKKR